MKHTWKKISALFLALALMTVTLVVPAAAAEQSSLYLDGYRAWLTPQSGGKIAVSIDVQAVDYMDEVGALTVKIYESADSGSTWGQVRTYYASMHPQLIVHDDYLYYDTPIYHQGTAGYKYFAVVEVYAGDSTGSDSREFQTYTVTAIS